MEKENRVGHLMCGRYATLHRLGSETEHFRGTRTQEEVFQDLLQKTG